GLGHVQAGATQGLMDLGDAAVFGVTQTADLGDHIEAEFMLGENIEALGLGPVGLAVAGAGAVVATAHIEKQADQSGEGGDGASVAVVGPQRLTTSGAMGKPRAKMLGIGGVGGGRPAVPSPLPDVGG